MAVDEVEVARLETELAEVRTAISNILLRGAAISVNGRALTRARLEDLYGRETVLLARLSVARRGATVAAYQVYPRG